MSIAHVSEGARFGTRVECEKRMKMRSHLANLTPLPCIPSDRGDNGEQREREEERERKRGRWRVTLAE